MRRKRTGKERRAIAERHGWVCYLSGLVIDPARDRWEIEHVIPLANGGTDDDDNLRPVLAKAHLAKTKGDLRKIAKGKRIIEKHTGCRKLSSRPMPFGRRSRLKKKLSGEIVERDS
jgi:5-methylcytosine-specific restriction endonuclease McrA